MKQFWVAAALLAGTLGSAHAWSDLERMQAVMQLSNVLASEELCELTYNQAKIEAYIEKTVPADDMEFAAELGMMTQGAQYNLGQMTPSTKTAHCAQIRRVAKSYGFSD